MLLRGSRSAAESSSAKSKFPRPMLSVGAWEKLDVLSLHHDVPPAWPGASGVSGRAGKASSDARNALGEKCQEVGMGASRGG